MEVIKTLGDYVIQDSDIVKAINNALSDTNHRIEKHYDEFKDFKSSIIIQTTKIEERLKFMQTLMISGFVSMFAIMMYMLHRIDQLQK